MKEVDDPMDLEMQLLSRPPANNDGGDSRTRKMMHTAILVVQSIQIFMAGTNHGSPPVSRASSSKSIDSCVREQDEIDIIERMEDDPPEFVDEPQTTPLLKAVDNTLGSRKTIRTLTHVLRSSLALKAYAASTSSDYVHHGTSRSIEGIPEVAEASDNLGASSEHHITVRQLHRSQSKNISEIVRQKNFPTLQAFGGVDGVADALGTDLIKGISGSEAAHRCHLQAFLLSSENTNKFFHLVWETVKSKTVILLLLAAGLSLVSGINEEGFKNGWYDGVVILIAIILLIFLASIRNYMEERWARKKLYKQQLEGRVAEVQVIRDGEPKHIYESKLVCGDVVLLKKGCQVPADGLFINGEDLELDCGSESYVIDMQNPFLSYGERVINGEARMVVTSINTDTGWSEMMATATANKKKRFKLETQLDRLNTCIHYTGLIISILIILVLIFRYMAGKIDATNGNRPESKAEPTAVRSFVHNFKKFVEESKFSARVLIKLLIVSLVGVTEGVPFVVSLSIFYWNNKTLSGKATEQDSQGVTKMASLTAICTDTFGNFTHDEMEVEKLFIGEEVITAGTTISPNVIEALCDGIGTLKQGGIHLWANDKLGFKRERMLQKWEFLERRGTDSFEELCCVLMSGTEESDEMVLHFNGPVKEILRMCTHYYDSKGNKVLMNNVVTRFFDQANDEMKSTQLRTIAVACKSTDTRMLEADDLVLVALLGLKNKNKEDTKSEVEAYRERGIKTIIVSSNKVSFLQDIALQCGVIANNDLESLVLTGEIFRKYTDEERLEKVDTIRVLGETLPSDKLLLVDTLKKRGEVVAFLEQRTDEAPALRGADIGIAMGTWSSEKARESCDIVIWDKSFSDLISIVDSGKCIYHNIQSFLQLVLISTTSSTLINFSQTVAFGDASLTIVQLVWVNLTVSFLGGLALLTKPSTDGPVRLVPIKCGRSFITTEMIRNILFQVVYQAICIVIIQLKGSEVMGTSRYTKTIIFNVFVLCQFFNQFNARELQAKNFFKGIHRHNDFWGAIATFIVLHATFIMVQDVLGYDTRLNWKLWAGCVLVGVGSWPVDWLGKCISWFIKMIAKKLRYT